MRVYTFTFFFNDDSDTTPEHDLDCINNNSLTFDDLEYLASTTDPDYKMVITVKDE